MKKIKFNNLIVYSLLLFLTACVPAKYKRYIVGEWKPIGIETVDNKQHPLVADNEGTRSSQGITSVRDSIKQLILVPGTSETRKKELESKINRIYNESFTYYEFKADGDARRIVSSGSSMKGTWKFTKRGKLLQLTDQDFVQPFILTVFSLSDSTMVVDNPSLSEGMKLTYRKQ